MTDSASAFIKDIEPFFYGRRLTYIDAGAFDGRLLLAFEDSRLVIREAVLVEPNPRSFAGLKDNAALLDAAPSVRFVNAALDSSDRLLELSLSEDMSKVLNVLDENPDAMQDSVIDLGERFNIKSRTLPSILNECGIDHVSILKIDVEGHELAVLKGASSFLKEQKIDVLYIEVGMDSGSNQHTYYQDVESELSQYGYRLFKIYEQNYEWIADSPFLRRANFAYMSPKFAANNPYRLSQEIFSMADRLETLRSSLKEANSAFDEKNIELDEVKIELSKANTELSKANADLATALEDLSDSEAGLADIRSALEKTQTELNAARAQSADDAKLHAYELQKRLKKSQQELRAAEASTAILKKQSYIQTRTLGYRVGHAITSNLSPSRFFRMPIAVTNAALAYRRAKPELAKAEQQLAKKRAAPEQEQKFAKVPSPAFPFPRNNIDARYEPRLEEIEQKPVVPPSTAVSVNKTSTAGASLAALAKQPYARHLVTANNNLGEEARWLDSLNQYISQFEISPIALKDGDQPIFSRLTAKTPYFIQDGPLVSILMPVYNAEETVQLAAASILEQSWRNIELIIVDDSSTDQTGRIIQEIAQQDPRVTAITNGSNVGPYVSKNFALKIAKGAFIAGHDGDDWAHPQWIESHVKWFSRGNGPASLFGMLRVAMNGEITRMGFTSNNTKDGALYASFISTMFDAAFLKHMLGHWDEVRFAGDSELIRRAELVNGEELPRVHHLSMLCLDSPTSLTRSTTHGISSDNRMSPSRRKYRDSYQKWHKGLNRHRAYLPFPQSRRPFILPDGLAVTRENFDSAVADFNTGTPYQAARTNIDCDVCMITDLCMPGGNATSTLDEFNLVKKRGLKVKLVHCPTPRSAWRPTSDRYNSCRSDIHYWHEINKINAPVIIVRQPVAACSLGFGQLMSSLHADVIYFEVNNSKFRASGEPTYDPATLEKRIASLNIPRKIIVPIGPAIRRELYSSFNDHSLISDRDWNPTFDIGQFSGAAKQTMSVPYKIGRHGRDAPEKWLESKEDLLSAYPDDPQFDIRILGGANAARKTLGELPANWRVTGFGGMEANAFLAELDVFVYFPSAGLNEAFGRTVMEAMFAGRPCILPDRFRETFGEMAFYGSPADVQRFVSRIAERNEDRMNFVDEVTNFAINNYSFEALNKRFHDMLNTNMKDPGASSEQVVGINAFLSERARSFKFWVES